MFGFLLTRSIAITIFLQLSFYVFKEEILHWREFANQASLRKWIIIDIKGELPYSTCPKEFLHKL